MDLVLFEAVEVVGVLALEEAAVYEKSVVGAGDVAVAAAGDAVGAAVVLEFWVVHFRSQYLSRPGHEWRKPFQDTP